MEGFGRMPRRCASTIPYRKKSSQESKSIILERTISDGFEYDFQIRLFHKQLHLSAISASQESYADCSKFEEFVLSDSSNQNNRSNNTLTEEVQDRCGKI